MGDRRSRSVLMVVAAGILWGVIGLFSRALNDAGLDSLQVVMARCSVTAVGAFILLALFKREFLRIHIKDIWMFFGTGVCSIILFNYLYFQTAQLVSLSMTAVLLYTAPCFVLIFSVFIFREKLTARKIMALVFAFGGCILTAGIIGSGGDYNVLGFAMGVGSGFGYSLYTIFSKFALRKYHPFTVIFYTFLVATIAMMPFCRPWEIVDVAINDTEALWYILGLGILITLVPYFLYTEGLNGLDAGVASVIAFVEPMVATIAGFIVYDEQVTLLNLTGIAMILFSLMLLNLDSGRLRLMFRERDREDNSQMSEDGDKEEV